MTSSPRPSDEAERLAALRSYGLIDTPPEAAFDDITALAAHVCHTPMAVLSLVDAERQWFKSRVNVAPPELPRDASICSHTIAGRGLLVVTDVAADPRFSGLPIVAGEPHVRFYAGAPLLTADNFAIGTLAVLDTAPHELTLPQRSALRTLARQIMAQLELRRQAQSASHLAAIIESSDDAIVGKSLDGIVTSWNRGAEQIFGYTALEMVGSSILRIIPPDRVDEERVILETVARGDGFQHLETKRLTKNGRLIDVSVTTSPIRDGSGAVVGVSKIARDITAQKQIEAQVLRAQRMESVGTLAGGIAHDLNNVLAPILMSVSVLRGEVTDPEHAAMLDAVKASAERGADLVQQVLSFARGVEGTRTLVDVAALLRELLTVMRDTFPKGIDLALSAPGDLWTVRGDPTQIHQVFLNLCVNARDAMGESGRLAVSMDNTVLDETYAAMNIDSRAGKYVVVTVADTGPGIPLEIRDRIFEPFFTTKPLGKGTGLGLSTSLGIVNSHRGFIHLYTEPGHGTKFKVYLPATTDDAPAREEIKEARLPLGRGELVLVVDDELAIRTVAKAALERFGYRVMLAANGAEAVALFAMHRGEIACVITDMAMPVMDGPATIIALKAIDPAVRIVGSSGLASNDGVAKAVGAGVEHFVAKPYTAETLLTTLEKLFR